MVIFVNNWFNAQEIGTVTDKIMWPNPPIWSQLVLHLLISQTVEASEAVAEYSHEVAIFSCRGRGKYATRCKCKRVMKENSVVHKTSHSGRHAMIITMTPSICTIIMLCVHVFFLKCRILQHRRYKYISWSIIYIVLLLKEYTRKG